MTFVPAQREQRFVLDVIADLTRISESDRFSAATADVVDALLDGVARFTVGEWAPLARVGDTVGARWTPSGVVMPDGYAAAYRSYVEQGWGTLGVPAAWGGEGLPFSLQAAVLEMLGAANMGLTLCPTLTAGAIEAIVHHGSPKQQALYLPKLATGAWTGTMNLTEPQAGSDVGALRTMATPLSDGTWSIRGTKIFISFGDHDMAENIVHLVLARTPDAPPARKASRSFSSLNIASMPTAIRDRLTTFVSCRSSTKWGCTHRPPVYCPSATKGHVLVN
jgi:alkylation response protein AidB-like acyl-CoA dehydrogenase